MSEKIISKAQSKEILSAGDLVMMGFTRGGAYKLLNRSDLPVIKIGGRKYMHAEMLRKWLADQATHKGA